MKMRHQFFSTALALVLASCTSISYVQRNSPSNAFKDYDPKMPKIRQSSV